VAALLGEAKAPSNPTTAAVPAFIVTFPVIGSCANESSAPGSIRCSGRWPIPS